MTLSENAFAVLGATPCDNRRILNQKADEAALLGGGDTEAALNQLMQMNRRIAAELRWFPASSPEAADNFLSYARALAEGRQACVPPMLGLGSTLAQANALAALFEIWPAMQKELFIGLCRALDAILSRVNVEETLRAINADRTAGGWETIPDVPTLLGPLNERLRELCAPAAQAAAKLDKSIAATTMKELFGPGGIDVQGNVAEAVSNAYAMRIHEKAEKYNQAIHRQMDEMRAANRANAGSLVSLRSTVDTWCSLTAPLRMRPGEARNEAKSIALGIRNLIVDYVNKSEPVQKTKKVNIPIFNGYKTLTIQYKSQRDYVDRALQLSIWLMNAFPEQDELRACLSDDIRTLNEILRKEEMMLANAEANAR